MGTEQCLVGRNKHDHGGSTRDLENYGVLDAHFRLLYPLL